MKHRNLIIFIVVCLISTTTLFAQQEIQEIYSYMIDAINKAQVLANEYQKSINDIGWGRILDPSRLKNDSTMIESKSMIKQARRIVSDYRKRNIKLIYDMRNSIQNLNLSEDMKERLRTGFESSMEDALKSIGENWDLEASILNEFEAIILLLKNVDWEIQDNQILFYNNQDVVSYNNHFLKINSLMEKQLKLQNKNIENYNKLWEILN